MVAQPLDRNATMPELGQVDREAGEFWVENPFMLPASGNNLSAYERNRVFLNVGGTEFLDASFASAADIDSDSRAVVAADFDRDGAPDLLVTSVGGGPLRLFMNRFPHDHNWVRIELTGTRSNRPAIGSRVVVEGAGRRIVRDLFAANGGTGQAPPELLIGVGDMKKIDTLTVRWPDGQTQTLTNVAVNGTLKVTEPAGD